MRLSIITPYYKTYKYIKELAKVLEPQLNDEIEWIIIDDGLSRPIYFYNKGRKGSITTGE